jgi:hypothetical protein
MMATKKRGINLSVYRFSTTTTTDKSIHAAIAARLLILVVVKFFHAEKLTGGICETRTKNKTLSMLYLKKFLLYV